MNEKKPIKISLSTFFLIIAIIVIVVMGIYIYKISVEKMKEEEKVEVLNSEVTELEGTVNNLQGKIDSIANTVNSNTNAEIENSQTNKEEVKFSNDEIKKALTSYLNIFKGSGSPEGTLEKLGLLNYGEYNSTTEDNYIKTDIKYSEFKKVVMNYMTENWFNTMINNNKSEMITFKEKDGLLYYLNAGMTGIEYEVKEVRVKGDYSALAYIGEVYNINVDDSKELNTIEFHIANNNGKCVISYCD